MELEQIIINRLDTSLTSKTSRELIELLDREKFNEFIKSNIGPMPFYYNTNLIHYYFCNKYSNRSKL